jgi:hypothetical protein
VPLIQPMPYPLTTPDGDTRVKADDQIVVLVSACSPAYAAAVVVQRWWRLSECAAAAAARSRAAQARSEGVMWGSLASPPRPTAGGDGETGFA